MAWGQRTGQALQAPSPQGPERAGPTTASWTLTPVGNGSVHEREVLTSIGSNVCFCWTQT